MEIKSEFIKYWNAEVSEIAKSCAKGFDLLQKGENSSLSAEERENVATQFNELGLKDPNAVWFIGLMIGDIHRSIMDNRPNLNLINSIGQVNGCLNSDSYWTNVWNNDITTEEAQNLKNLASLTSKLISLI
jgi:hypothetical protein